MNASRPGLVSIALGAILLAAISATTGYWFASAHGHSVDLPGTATGERAASEETPDEGIHGVGGRKPLYWYDPMRPDQHFDQPGKSPYMDMQLVPRYADAGADAQAQGVRIDPTLVQNLGIRYTRVGRGALPQGLDAVGTVGFNQRDIAIVQARSDGFVTRVYARAPGDVIARDAPIVDLLVPQWAGAQTEFLALLKSGDPDLIRAARQRLVLLGMPPELIGSVESAGVPHTNITIRSPIAGMIDRLEARAGMTVAAGATIAQINGLGTVWIEAAIPEAQGAPARLGKQAQVRLTAYPGRRFSGRVIEILPETNGDTHTARVRIELANPDRQLRPGMFAQVRLEDADQTPVLYVDSEAVIRTGTRAVVIVSGEQGRFIPTQVQTGADVDGKTVIVNGLTEGQTVVASGQFLIDSEASLKGVLARLADGNSEHVQGPQVGGPGGERHGARPGGQP